MARRRSRRSSARRRRRYNPGFARPLGAVSRGFSIPNLKEGAVVAGGMFVQHAAKGFVAMQFPAAGTGILKNVVGLGIAGLQAMIPRYGSRMFIGAMAYEVGSIMRPFVARFFPSVMALGDYATAGEGLEGIADYMFEGEGLAQLPMADISDYEEVGETVMDDLSLDPGAMFN